MTDEDREQMMANTRALFGGGVPPAGRSARNMRRCGRGAAMLPQNKRRSTTAGVQAHQAKDFNEQVKAAGITGVEYCTKTGDMLYASERAKQPELKRRKIFAKDSIFSPQND